MAVVTWKNANRPTLASMAVTARLDDLAAGDTTTGETSSASISFGAGCAYHRVDAYLTALWDFGALVDLTAWRFTANLTFNTGDIFTCPLPEDATPPLGQLYTAAIEYSADGLTWKAAATPAVGGGPQTITGSFLAGAVGQYVRVILHGLNETYDQSDTISTNLYLSDFRASGTAVAEDSIAQCQTRSLPVTGTHPTLAFLWEVWLGSTLIDYADRYDRFGKLGWGILLPGLAGAGTLTLSAPGHAPIALGYTARSAGLSVDFAVTAGTCPDTGGGQKVADNLIFSTGILLAYPVLPSAAISRINVGAPPAAVNPLASAADGSAATLLDLTFTDGANYQYAQIDYGALITISTLILSNVSSGAALTVYASATAIADGNFGAATLLPLVAGVQPASAAPLRFEGAALSARYLYIVPGAAATIGEMDGRGRKTPFGVVQNAAPGMAFNEALLRGPTWVSEYPVADAQYDMAFSVSADFASFDVRAAEILAGANLDTSGNPTRNTATLTSKPQRFTVEFIAQSIDGKPIRVTAYDCVAPGFTWKFGRAAFAIASFVAKVFRSVNNGIPWKIEVDI